MIKETWKEFCDSRMLWFTNRILHAFGWVIVLEEDDTGDIVNVYPARTNWLGFEIELDKESRKAFLQNVTDDDFNGTL